VARHDIDRAPEYEGGHRLILLFGTTLSIGVMTVENIAPVADLSVTVSSSEAQHIPI
jgi:hypothetical protein